MSFLALAWLFYSQGYISICIIALYYLSPYMIRGQSSPPAAWRGTGLHFSHIIYFYDKPRSILHALSGDQALLLIQATIINRL